MSNADLGPILDDLAAGRIDAAEAGRRIEAAKQAAAGPVTRDTCTPGLEQLRDTVKLVTRANDKIKDVSDLRKWNTRAVGIANIAPLLQTALDTLDRCLLAWPKLAAGDYEAAQRLLHVKAA